MPSKRRTQEEIKSIALYGQKLGLAPSLVGKYDRINNKFTPGLCTTIKQVDNMYKLYDWICLEYGLEYTLLKKEENIRSEKPDLELNKLLDAVDTIREYTDKYYVPQLTERIIVGNKKTRKIKMMPSLIDDLEETVKYLRPPPPKEMKKFIGKVRKIVKEKIEIMPYDNKKRLIDGLMNTFTGKEFNELKGE